MIYQDKRGHFTSEENNGGECPHNNLQKLSIDELKTLSQIEIDKENFADFIQKKRNKEYTARQYIICKIYDREKKFIEQLTGRKLNAFFHSIYLDEFHHIENNHGENGKKDKTMATLDDYKNIIDVLHNFDNIYIAKKHGKIDKSSYTNEYGEKAVKIIYSKNIKGKEKIVVEAITGGKNKDIRIITSYTKKE